MAATRYPLAWPDGWRRIPAGQRKRGTFGRLEKRPGNSWPTYTRLTVHDATCRVRDELERLGVVSEDDILISTNIRVRLDGLPRSGEPEPQDPGVAVYWERPGEPPRCMAVDLYDRVADNLAAIAATLEAMRAIERHGGAAILDRAFSGFAALPAPATAHPARSWREILGFTEGARISLDDARAAYRRMASEHHPDRGGDPDRMAEINRAWQQAQEALG